MTKTRESWVIVANGTKARFFKIEKGCLLVESEGLVHPEGRLLEKDLVEGKAGAGLGNTSHTNRSAMSPQASPKEVELINFAKKVSDHIESIRATGSLERLYLAATPSLLGLLRQTLSRSTANLIYAEIDKDITHLKPEEIRNYFPIGMAVK